MSANHRTGGRRLRRAAIALISATAALCALGAPALADTGIAYDSEASPSGLWTMAPDGTNPEPFLPGASGVNFSADQSKMVYQVGGSVACNVNFGGGQIIAANADGSDPVNIGAGGCSPRISPDGTQVLYIGAPVNGSDTPLYVAKISDPTNPVQLLPFPGPGGPDACIAFVNASYRNYPNNQSVCSAQLAAWVSNTTIVVSGFQNGLWEIPVTGGDPHPILSGTDQSSDWYNGLSVSPDGSTIAGYPLSQTAGSFVLVTVPSGGGALKILYDQGNTGVSYDYPQWLDDQTLVMQHAFGPAANPISTIAVSSASAFSPTDLNATDTTASFPAPAPVCPAPAASQALALDRTLNPTANALGLCQLDLAAQASTTEPTSGYADQDNNAVEFVTKLTDGQPQPVMAAGATTSFLQSCLSGCASVAVRATAPGGAPVAGASITATLNPLVFQAAGVSIPSPFSVLPPSTGVGVLCAVGTTSCGQSATATTDDNGFAQFRYWLPGLVEAAINVAYPGPSETIKFDGTSAHGVCLCGAEGKTSLSLELKPRLWVNRDEKINDAKVDPNETAGLKAILSDNATNAKNSKTRATNIIKLLKAAHYFNGVVIKSLKGLTDIGQSDAMVRLMHKDASSVMLAWFMGKFQIAGDGLLDGNLDPRAWGQELKPVIVNFLANKIEGAGKLGKAIGKFDTQLRDQLDALLEKGIGKAFEQQATAITKEIIERRGAGTATLKLFDVSVCKSGLCTLPPSPVGASQQLFLMFSEHNPREEINYFWPHGDLTSEAPLNIDAQRWIHAQCNLSCDTENK
jgi:hypothetical protein